MKSEEMDDGMSLGELLKCACDWDPEREDYNAVQCVSDFIFGWILDHGYYYRVESHLEKETGVKGIGKVLDGRKKHIEIDWLVRLALALNVTPNDLLGFTQKEDR